VWRDGGVQHAQDAERDGNDGSACHLPPSHDDARRESSWGH
jgi:hypothetical protein